MRWSLSTNTSQSKRQRARTHTQELLYLFDCFDCWLTVGTDEERGADNLGAVGEDEVLDTGDPEDFILEDWVLWGWKNWRWWVFWKRAETKTRSYYLVVCEAHWIRWGRGRRQIIAQILECIDQPGLPLFVGDGSACLFVQILNVDVKIDSLVCHTQLQSHCEREEKSIPKASVFGEKGNEEIEDPFVLFLKISVLF